jgi:hypothetical protein
LMNGMRNFTWNIHTSFWPTACDIFHLQFCISTDLRQFHLISWRKWSGIWFFGGYGIWFFLDTVSDLLLDDSIFFWSRRIHIGTKYDNIDVYWQIIQEDNEALYDP